MQGFESSPPPLSRDADGVIRVEGTRLPLETLVTAFDAGATAEEIVHQFPSLDLGDVYAVIAYVLGHRESVDAYVEQRGAAAAGMRAEVEQTFPPAGIRARLLARRGTDASR